MGARPPQLNGDEIASAISRLSREPFQEVLTLLLEARPDREAVYQFAKKYPDRWAQGVAILARLGGYHDKLEIDAKLTVNISRLSDMELMGQLAEIQKNLAALEDDPDSALENDPEVRTLPSPK